jgi:hypothetical protein
MLLISNTVQALETMNLTVDDTGQQSEAVEKILDCQLELHEHSSGCYDKDRELICGFVDYVVHTHDENCYDGSGALACTLPEVKEHTHESSCYKTVTAHTHGDSCYTEERELTCGQEAAAGHTHDGSCYRRDLICGQEEGAGHTHSESCYQMTKELICGQAETAGHTHGESCYDGNGDLICGQEEHAGHTHGEGCYQTVTNLICGQEEGAGHTHGDGCYQKELICGQEEAAGHAHTDSCYTSRKVLTCQEAENGRKLTCTKKEAILHTHTSSCYDENNERTCEKQEVKEHQHTDDCFRSAETVQESSESVETAEGAPAETESGSTEDSEESDSEESDPEAATETESETESESRPEPEALEVVTFETLSSAIRSVAAQDAEVWNQVMMAAYDEELLSELAERFGVEKEFMQQYQQYMEESFNVLYDAMDEEALAWDELQEALSNEELLNELSERYGVDTETLRLFISYNKAAFGISATVLEAETASENVNFYTVNGSVAFSLNPDLTKKETQGAAYTLVLTNPSNNYTTVQSYCSNPYYKNSYHGTWWTAGCILWCVNRYNEQWANIGVSSYGIPSSQKWEALRQAIQYAVWYYSSSYTLNSNSSDPIVKLAIAIKDDAWTNSATTDGDGKIYWYKSNDSAAPNLVSFAYSGTTATAYIGTETSYVTEIGTITGKIGTNGARVIQNSGEQQLGFCYDPNEANASGDTYYYGGILNDYQVRKILYNGYPYNKELLHQTGMSAYDLYWQTQEAVAYVRGGNGGSGALYDLLVGGGSSETVDGKTVKYTVINGVKVTMQDPPDDFVVHYYYSANRQTIIVPSEPLLVYISGTKTWVDDDESTRPSEVEMQLYKRVGGVESPVMKNGTLITFKATASDSWEYHFSNMPRYENGEVIEYFVKELNVPEGYISTVNGMNVTNTWKGDEGSLTVAKTVAGDLTDLSSDVEFYFQAVFTKEDGTPFTDTVFWTKGSDSDSWTPDETGKVTFQLMKDESITMKLPEGVTYEVQEINLPENFTLTSLVGEAQGTIAAGQTASLTFVNTFQQPDTVALTLRKQVGNEHPDTNQAFAFNISLKDAAGNPVTGSYVTETSDGLSLEGSTISGGQITFTNGAARVSLKSGEWITITGLPEGCQYAIEEEENTHYTANVTIEAGENQETLTTKKVDWRTMAGNESVLFVNMSNSLTLTKEVTGTLADTNQQFTFDIRLMDQNGTALTGQYATEISAISGVDTAGATVNYNSTEPGLVTVTLKHGQSVTFQGLPNFFRYEIQERNETATDALYEVSAIETYTDGVEIPKDFAPAKNLVQRTVAGTGACVDNEVKYINHRTEEETISLLLTKLVSGELGEKNKAFEFQITLKDKDQNALSGTYEVVPASLEGVDLPVIDGNKLTFTDGKATVSLKHGQSVTILGLPIGYGYEIQELEKVNTDKQYTTEIAVKLSTGIKSGTDTVKGKTITEQNVTVTKEVQYTNTKEPIARTGIRTDLIPFVVGCILVFLLAVMFSLSYIICRRNRRLKYRNK